MQANVTQPFWLIIISLAAAFLPMLVCIFSTYLRFSIVLTLIKTGFGVPSFPSNILIALISTLLTTIVMGTEIKQSIVVIQNQNLSLNKLPNEQDLERISQILSPYLAFISKYAPVQERDLISRKLKNSSSESQIMILAYISSELKIATKIGIKILIPFLVIDSLVAFILSCLGMYSLSANTFSLPLKLIAFTAADGWLLLFTGLLRSFNG